MAWEPDYAEVADLTAYMEIDDDADDVWAAGAVAAASRSIDQATRRQFGNVDDLFEERRYRPRIGAGGCWVIDIDDLFSATGLLVDGEPVDPLLLEPISRPTGRPYTRLQVASCAVHTLGSNAWGWATVPATVHTACLIQGSRFMVRRHSPYGIAGSPQGTGEVRLASRVDPDVAVMLRGYIRRAVPR
jgi:hypothetical protein